jgi:hypothetical protein
LAGGVLGVDVVLPGVVADVAGQGPGLGVIDGVVPPFDVVAGLAGVVVFVVDVVELGWVAVLAGAVGAVAGAAMALAVKKPLAMKAVRISLRMANLLLTRSCRVHREETRETGNGGMAGSRPRKAR